VAPVLCVETRFTTQNFVSPPFEACIRVGFCFIQLIWDRATFIQMQATVPARESAWQGCEAAGPEPVVSARYQSLIRLAEFIRARRTPQEFFDLLACELCRVVRFDAIAQFDDAANKVRWHIRDGYSHESQRVASELPKEQTIAWWVHQQQQALLIANVDRETRFPAAMEQLRAHGMRSVCALPLSTAHRRLGSIMVASASPDAYSGDDMGFFALAASQVALAMDDALNFQASNRAHERLSLLLDLTNSVVSNLDLRDLLRAVAASIRRVMQCDGVGIGLPDAANQLQLYALDYPNGHGLVREGYQDRGSDETAAEAVFRSGQPKRLTADELRDDAVAVAEGARAACHLPLIGRDHVLGVLTLGRRQDKTFSDDEFEFLIQVARQVAIAVENALAFGQITELKDRLAQEKLYLEDEIRSELNFEEIVGRSDALRRVLREVETVAPTDSTVLIYGETGTGKELIARAVHNLSVRARNAFVKLNCAAIPTGLLESELFGHEKGAFTGAISQRAGRFELANGGTVFLDEVGEIPLELQPKLLRVLQEREFERLGSSRTLRTDARLIAATNRDLRAMVDQQQFRSDLYYRLNVFPLRVPPLRERPEDIPLLVRHFVQQFSRRANRQIDTISSETMNTLVRYHWPGNIRELQNVIERAVILSSGSTLRAPLDDVAGPASFSAPEPAMNGAAHGSNGIKAHLESEERRRILEGLEASRWIVAGPNGAAARLGLKRSTLQSRMQKLGIRISRSGAA
jgi:formate hydrogenlyase transcriptional activator